MSKQREAMQFALETLEDIFGKHKIDVTAINMLRNALAEPEQKPVARMLSKPDRDPAYEGYNQFSFIYDANWNIPLHTALPARKPLTVEEIHLTISMIDRGEQGWLIKFARAIEQAHGIGE